MSSTATSPRAGSEWFTGTTAESLRLATAPSTGRLRPLALPGTTVRAGEVLAFITGSRGRADAVHSPDHGVVRELLARPGQLVSTGRALVWVEAVSPAPAAALPAPVIPAAPAAATAPARVRVEAAA